MSWLFGLLLKIVGCILCFFFAVYLMGVIGSIIDDWDNIKFQTPNVAKTLWASALCAVVFGAITALAYFF